MPGRLFLTSDPGLAGVAAPPARLNIKPGEMVWTLTEDGPREMRWGMIPVGRVNARGRPVMETIINARSETVFDKSAYEGVKRAVVPADGWYEWTGEKQRKQPWRISRKDGALLWFAAIFDVWKAPGGTEVAQVAMVTCEPNSDLRDVHHRMGVLLTTEHIGLWLSGPQEAAAALMQPFPDGQLLVEPANDVDLS